MERLIGLIERSATVVLLLRTTAGKAAILIVMLLAQIPLIVIKSYDSFSAVTSSKPVAMLIAVCAALAYDVVVFSLAINGRVALSWVMAFFAALMSVSTYPAIGQILQAHPSEALAHVTGIVLRVFPPFVVAYYSHMLKDDYDALPNAEESETKITTHTGRMIAEKVGVYTAQSLENFKKIIKTAKI